MAYTVEIILPGSGKRFSYASKIESREEAEYIRREAEVVFRARVRNI